MYKVVDKNKEIITTDEVLHPGEVIDMELEARGFKKGIFANQLNIKPTQLSEILHGKRNINAMLALKLEQILSIEAGFWLRLQNDYDLAIARQMMSLAA